MEIPKQSPKGLRVATRCHDIDQFVRTFHRYSEDSGVFISNAKRSIGEVIAFSFDLTDGSPALCGVGAVIEQFTTGENRFGRPGIVVALSRLTRNTKQVFEDLVAARVSAEEQAREEDEARSPTSVPIAEARAFTANIRMVDPDTLTPIPGPPPSSLDGRRAPASPLAVQIPDPNQVPLRPPRTATRPIAIVATTPPPKRTPTSMKIPPIVGPDSPVRAAMVAQGSSTMSAVSTEAAAPASAAPVPAKAAEVAALASAAPVVAQPAPVVAQPAPVVAQPAPIAADDAWAAEHDAWAAEHDAPVAEHDAPVAEHDARVADHDATVADHDATVGDHDATVAEPADPMAERTARVSTPPEMDLSPRTADVLAVARPAAYEPAPLETPRVAATRVELPGLPPSPSAAVAAHRAPLARDSASAMPPAGAAPAAPLARDSAPAMPPAGAAHAAPLTLDSAPAMPPAGAAHAAPLTLDSAPAMPPVVATHAAPLARDSAPAMVPAVAAHPAPLARDSAPVMPAAASRFPTPVPALAPAPALFAPPVMHANEPRRWSARKIWLVASAAGASLLAIGIVIGAMLVGDHAPRSTASPTPAASPSATLPAPPPVASPPPAPSPPAPKPATEVAAPTTEVTAPTPPAVTPPPAPPPPAHAVVKTPEHTAVKTPARPTTRPKRPPHAKSHKHTSHSSGCTSLKCL